MIISNIKRYILIDAKTVSLAYLYIQTDITNHVFRLFVMTHKNNKWDSKIMVKVNFFDCASYLEKQQINNFLDGVTFIYRLLNYVMNTPKYMRYIE